MAKSYQPSETGLRIDLGTLMSLFGLCYCPLRGCNSGLDKTPCRDLNVMGLVVSSLCRRCGAEKEIAAHVLCKCEAWTTLRHHYMGSFVLHPEGVRNLTVGAIWNIIINIT